MKKIFLIFVCFLILVSCLVLPCMAHMPNSFGDHPNYLNSNYGTISRFYTSPTEYTDEYFFTTNLKPNTTYTFYSTSGTKRLYIGQQIVYNNYNSAFSYDSTNLLNTDALLNNAFVRNADGSFTLTKVSDNERYSNYVDLLLPSSTYTLTVNILSGDVPLRVQILSSSGSLYYAFSSSGSCTFTSPVARLRFYLNSTDANGTSSVVFNLSLTESSSSLPYEPFYVNPVFNDEFTYVYNFTTPSTITTDTPILVGINDYTQFNSNDKYFSRYQATENSIPSNDFYLIEGTFSPDELANIDLESSYNSGYNSGYDDGYKIGESDGLSSTSFMRSTIFTILSAPFVIVSNALDFDLLGINIYNLVKVSITVLLIAWIITRLKGRE